jgi:two-component system, NarL family, invasion response regulator UvrY
LLRVLIADDHAIVRKGLRDILREAAQDALVGEASNGLEALELARSEAWDVVVLDITMPGASGLAVLKQLKRDQHQRPVLMLSMHSGQRYVNGSLKVGASGYLNKKSAPEELLTAIRTVLAGETYISQSLKSGRAAPAEAE